MVPSLPDHESSHGYVALPETVRSPWWSLGFAGANALAAVYGFLQGAWPFGLIEIFWCLAALNRFRTRLARST